MPFELKDIKQIRKRSGLTQGQLAKLAGVSQSLIAKIESNRIDPTYSKTQKIFEALENINKQNQTKAGSIIHRKIVSIAPNENVKKAIKIMKKHSISQMPVIENEKLVGLVSESIILDSLMNKKSDCVKDIMEDAPPVISAKTGINIITDLLRHFPIVVVADNGKLKGVIAKSDLLKQLY
ncbi:hypothetical protein CMO89_02085 [Candidatus Woesearchaeota archaeon]|nr:hypothetical protein [Candidatus Woesearchaeota archaeon]|tara:strand:- start:6232 stop:6771 length:540 start_codon:yes stop_codon:yes gene_type:complete